MGRACSTPTVVLIPKTLKHPQAPAENDLVTCRKSGEMWLKENLLRNCLLIAAGLTIWTADCSAQPRSGDSQYRVNRKFIYPKEFPAGTPYPPGVLAGETLSIPGQIDKDPQPGAQPKGIAEQTRMAMTNMGHVL